MILKVLWISTGKLYDCTEYMQKLQICRSKMGNCTCQRPSSHTSSCVFFGFHLDIKVDFFHFTLPLSDVSSCSINFNYENMDINFSKFRIIEDVCLRFPSALFHVIKKKKKDTQMIWRSNIPFFFRKKFNAVTLQPNRGLVCLRNTAGNFSFSDTIGISRFGG